MSLLARPTPASVRRLTPRGAAHFNHAAPTHLPFGFDKKATFRAKYLTFVGVGFSLPFIAAYWQLRKASAGSA